MKEVTEFEWWLRTGRELAWGEERKFNPWHDPEDGRFTFSNQGKFFGSGSSSADQTQMTRPPPAQPVAKKPVQAPSPGRQPQPTVVDAPTRVRDDFKKHVIPFEGERDVVYTDSEGFLTVGIGHRVVPADKLKAGERITPVQKEAFWKADADAALDAARFQMRQAGISDAPFLLSLASVNFQLGPAWKYDHKKTWSLIKAGSYAAAATEAQNSDWFAQSPKRVRALQAALLTLEAKKGRKK